MGESIRKTLKDEIEGVLYYFIHASRVGHSSSTAPYAAEALPLLLAVHEDGDREFAQVVNKFHQVLWNMEGST